MAEDLSTVVNAADQIGSSIDLEDLTKATSDGSKSVVEEIQKLSPTLNAIEMAASGIESMLQGMEENLSSVADSLAPDMTEYDPNTDVAFGSGLWRASWQSRANWPS